MAHWIKYRKCESLYPVANSTRPRMIRMVALMVCSSMSYADTNEEGNYTTPLLGTDINSSTSVRQHDKALIRIPAHIVIAIEQSFSSSANAVTGFVSSRVRRLRDWISFANIWRFWNITTIITSGVLLFIFVFRGDFPIVLLMIFTGATIALAIFEGIQPG